MHHEIHGLTEPEAPTVVLSSGLGGAAHYWTPQIPALTEHFRVVTYDHYGTGRSAGALPAGYAVADMAAELANLLDDLSIRKAHFIGHALGGLIGLQLALDRPALLDRLVLVNAWGKTHPHTLRCFAARKSLLLNTGISAYIAAQPLFLYPAAWLAERQDWVAEQDAAGVAHFPPQETVLGRIAAVEAFDLTTHLSEIAATILMIATRDDILVPHTCSAELAAGVRNGRMVLLEQGGHACNVTDPARFDALVGEFLEGP